ncbi:hypothetical protein [Flavobacterium sedimenticola]|uniref:Uncharacterized protein n=1 Tax=Flavobacterium sedimenticola TaxID=3043286 RepID=A0ABT6XMN1_9FLAO|nr:hypothetical protein [Flavobacterium sedimenticola]MDI9256334.1 hypothetical protein [Flavobacterium sedimenticola]
MSKQDRATKIEKEKRIFIVQGWIIEGVQDHLIVKNIVERWGLTVRQAQRYVKDAYENWKEIEGVKVSMKRTLKIARYKQLIKSLKDEYKGTPAGIRAIAEVEKRIDLLEGLEPDKTIKLELPEVAAVKFNVVYGNRDNG